MTIDMPSSVSTPMPSRCAMYVFTRPAAHAVAPSSPRHRARYLSSHTSWKREKL